MLDNPYLKQFRDRLDRKLNQMNQTVTDWICSNTTIKDQPYAFNNGHEFQRQIIDDLHPNLCVKKPSQVGMTEGQLRKALAFVKMNPGTTCIYSLPTINLKENVGKVRAKPMVEKDLPGTTEEARSAYMMQFGTSWLMITACVESDATSTPADMVLNDEFDLSDQEILELFNSRLQKSKHQIKQGFSTPTWAGFGITQEYELSDQHEYFRRCSHCNHRQIPRFSRESLSIPGLPDDLADLKNISRQQLLDVDLDRACWICEKCGKPLDMSDHSTSEWVAKYPSRTNNRGYFIRPSCAFWLKPKKIITDLCRYTEKGFQRRGVNTILGEEHTDMNARLEEDTIKAMMVSPQIPDIPKTQPVLIGIDMGLVCHIVIGDERNIFRFMTCPVDNLEKFLVDLDEKYNIVGGAIDRYPYTPTANAIREWSNNRIMPVEYRGSKDATEVKDQTNEITHYQVNRTAALDRVASAIRKGRLLMQGYCDQQNLIVTHLRDNWRDDSPKADGEGEAVWCKLHGTDHYFHAIAFMLSVPEMLEVHTAREGFTRQFLFTVIEDKKVDDRTNIIGYSSAREKSLNTGLSINRTP